MRRANAAAVLSLGVAALSLSGIADAQSSILHEYFEPDPSEDVALAATTLEGDLPAALETDSGLTTAPDPMRSPSEGPAYSGATADDGPDSTFEPDRDTRRPDVEAYDDPFSPATAPFKRLRAYDAVGVDYTLRVADRSLETISVGGAAEPGDDEFYGDLVVELVPGEPVRIPTVGPGSRILRLHSNPDTTMSILRDGADNWFVRSETAGRVRLVMQLAIPRATFGSEFANVSWDELDPYVRDQPYEHRASFERVAAAIGVSRDIAPKVALERLVAYFRSFEASDEPPTGQGDIYLDLALSRRGVCRHRAFAFLVTALNLGLPTRMVVNEAHAWVEVLDGSLWHRIDLGGAALDLDHDADPSRPPHEPPADPFEWPEGAQDSSGQELADRTRPPSATSDPDQAGAGSGGSSGQPSGGPGASPGSSTAPRVDDRPPTELELALTSEDALRGTSIRASGSANADGLACGRLRIDIRAVSATRPQGVSLGTLSTDGDGDFEGSVVVPRDIPPGDYEVIATTPGDARCPPATSE